MNYTEKDEKVKRLIEEFSFDLGTALAYVESNGKCVYCGTDLLDSLLGYFSADKEHLLPKSKYPEAEGENDNFVLSCRACNLLKGKVCIENLQWEPKEAIIGSNKEKLIQMYAEKIRIKRNARELELESIRNIIRT